MPEKEAVGQTPEPVAEGQADKGVGGTGAPVYSQAEVDRTISKAFEKWQREKDQAIEEERRKAEENRLREQGQYQKLFEESSTELKRLKDEAKAREFNDSATKIFNDAGVGQFASVLLAPRQSTRDVETIARSFTELFDKSVEAEVSKRLETGVRPRVGSPPQTKDPDKMTTEEWKVERTARWGIH